MEKWPETIASYYITLTMCLTAFLIVRTESMALSWVKVFKSLAGQAWASAVWSVRVLTDFLREPRAASLSRVSTFLEKEVSYIHFYYEHFFFFKIFICGCYGETAGFLEYCLLGCLSFSFPAVWRLGDLKLKQTLSSSCLSGLCVKARATCQAPHCFS